jgi:hypothetical protein
VQPLAKSRGTLNQLDLMDVAVAWAAFEEINQVEVVMSLSMFLRGAVRELQLTGVAWDRSQGHMDRVPLVLAKSTSWVFNHRTLSTAAFHLLYTLDGLIANSELSGADRKKA